MSEEATNPSRREQIKSWLSLRPQLVMSEESWRDLRQQAYSLTDKQLAELEVRRELPAIPEMRREYLEFVGRKRRNLPHLRADGFCYFVTMTVHERRPLFADAGQATIVEQSLWYLCEQSWMLDAYVIMPDHIHFLIAPLPGVDPFKTFSRFRSFTGRNIGPLAGLRGPLWQSEPFDHVVRNQAYWVKFMDYIHGNPKKARLAKRCEDYRFSSLSQIYGFGAGRA